MPGFGGREGAFLVAARDGFSYFVSSKNSFVDIHCHFPYLMDTRDSIRFKRTISCLVYLCLSLPRRGSFSRSTRPGVSPRQSHWPCRHMCGFAESFIRPSQ
jgi:hypothetical protein